MWLRNKIWFCNGDQLELPLEAKSSTELVVDRSRRNMIVKGAKYVQSPKVKKNLGSIIILDVTDAQCQAVPITRSPENMLPRQPPWDVRLALTWGVWFAPYTVLLDTDLWVVTIPEHVEDKLELGISGQIMKSDQTLKSVLTVKYF